MPSPKNSPPPLDLVAWLAKRGIENGGGSTNGLTNGPSPRPPVAVHTPGENGNQNSAIVASYATTALAREADAVARAQPGERNNQLNSSAYSCFRLVAAGAITADEVERVLGEAARSIGLSDDEIRKTFGSASGKGLAKPRDLSNVGVSGNGSHNQILGFHQFAETFLGGDGSFEIAVTPGPGLEVLANGHTNGHANDHANHHSPRIELDTIPAGMEDNPHYLAQLFANRMQHTDGLRLRFWRDEFHWWDETAYRVTPAKEIRAELTQFVASQFYKIYQTQMMQYGIRKKLSEGQTGGGGGGEGEAKGPGRPAGPPKPIPVTTRLIGDILQALSGISLLPLSRYPSQPAWIARKGVDLPAWKAIDVLPARNALVHLPSVVAGEICTHPTTPLFFSSYALDYSFDETAIVPVAWLEFLNQLWPDDSESIETLQEWMGYLLTSDTSLQKIMMIIGPKRSGKGTIARVIRAMVGTENVVNPTITGLTDRFGLEPMLNKTIAIITDARIGNRTDTSIAIERLLSISGEDSQTVDRKHTGAVTTKLNTRFTLISNELPRMRDSSGALVGRMVFLQLTNSFYGKEDLGLFDRLLPEMAGILRWAITGWARLKERGTLRQPKSGKSTLASMDDLSSPIKSFVRECCKVGNAYDFIVPRTLLFDAWKSWCHGKGITQPGEQDSFGRNLRATVPGLGDSRPSINGKQVRHYKGIRLLKEHEVSDDEEKQEEEQHIFTEEEYKEQMIYEQYER